MEVVRIARASDANYHNVDGSHTALIFAYTTGRIRPRRRGRRCSQFVSDAPLGDPGNAPPPPPAAVHGQEPEGRIRPQGGYDRPDGLGPDGRATTTAVVLRRLLRSRRRQGRGQRRRGRKGRQYPLAEEIDRDDGQLRVLHYRHGYRRPQEFAKLLLDNGSTLKEIPVEEAAKLGDAATRSLLRQVLVESSLAKIVRSSLRAPRDALERSEQLASILPREHQKSHGLLACRPPEARGRPPVPDVG